MVKIFAVLLAIFIFQGSVHAADEIRIGFPWLSAQHLPLILGEK
jgi:hypothetical protein